MKNDSWKPEVVLSVAAHPDDIDFGFGGSIAQWAEEGTKVYYLIISDGSKGTADHSISRDELITRRQVEQRAAAASLGAEDVYFLDYPDSELELTFEIKRQICRYIRRLKPDTVLTMDPTMVYSTVRGFINHPDHRVVGQATLDAVFPLARDHLSFPDLLAEGLEPHKVSILLLVNFNAHNFAVDIGSTLQKKLAALKLHVSQMADPDLTAKFVTKLAAETGKQYGYKYAEAFVRIDIS